MGVVRGMVRLLPESLRTHRGFRLMLLCGAGAGVAVSLWLIFAPKLWGLQAWFPFAIRLLITELELRWLAAPLPFAGWAVLYWLTPALALGALFTAPWWVARREELTLERQILIQQRRVEHKDRVDEAARIWSAFEAAELKGNADEQLRLLEQYNESAQWVELASDERQDRVQRCMAVAERIGQSEPHLSLKLLEQAKALRRSGRTRHASMARLMAPDLLGYALGALLIPLLLPFAALLVFGAAGIVLWILRLVIAALVIMAIIGALASR